MDLVQINEYPDYFISKEGFVWSSKSNKYLSLATDKDGYKIVTLYRNGSCKKFKVHRLVAETFICQDIAGKQVNHKDEDPSNNNVGNLEICDCSI